MAKVILIVGGAHPLPNGGIVLGVNTREEKLRYEWKEKSFTDLERQFTGKYIRILGEEYEIPK